MDLNLVIMSSKDWSFGAGALKYSAGDDIDGNPTLLYNYYNEDRDLEYRYLTVLYQADDGFWMVQFASVKDDFDTYEPSFVEAAKSVSFGA